MTHSPTIDLVLSTLFKMRAYFAKDAVRWVQGVPFLLNSIDPETTPTAMCVGTAALWFENGSYWWPLTPEHDSQTFAFLERHVSKIVPAWNDCSTRTHAEVIEMLDSAIEARAKVAA